MAGRTAAEARGGASRTFDVARARADFPILKREVHGHPLVYLDSAASAQKPRQVLDAMREVYETSYANVHRGVYYLSERATALYEEAREKARRFVNARSRHEIVFTKGGTEAINLVAASYGRGFLKAGDEVVVSELEHHSNIVPWQILRESAGIVLKVARIEDDGDFRPEALERAITPRTRLVAISHMSNVLGTVLPAKEIVAIAHAHGAKVLLDGCQAAVHLSVDVQEIGCDFYAFTGHKVYGPNAIGVLYGREDLLAAMPPYQGGGEMIKLVTFEKTTFADPPAKFEAGTPPIVPAIGLGVALDYLESLGRERIARHEAEVLAYGMERLGRINRLRLVGTAPSKASVLSFVLDEVHPHDVATVLDRAGVAVRAGHHCAQPLMQRLGLAATVRASLGLYSTRSDIDALVAALDRVKEIFG
ncbi:MAG: cysteine desulfurase [Proteobacteria bacterium]|nr:cysteine desulfurase [Pseudomonadota bacterium]